MGKSWPEDFCGTEVWVSDVSYDTGLLMKYGTAFGNRQNELQVFQHNHNIHLPDDFLSYIGDSCEAGFDGYYRVARFAEGDLVWSHLLLMRLPMETDLEHARERIISRILEKHESLFFTDTEKNLRYFPFGEATLFNQTGTEGVDGFLVFSISEQYAVYFVGKSKPKRILLAKSFKAMIEGSQFLHFG